MDTPTSTPVTVSSASSDAADVPVSAVDVADVPVSAVVGQKKRGRKPRDPNAPRDPTVKKADSNGRKFGRDCVDKLNTTIKNQDVMIQKLKDAPSSVENARKEEQLGFLVEKLKAAEELNAKYWTMIQTIITK